MFHWCTMHSTPANSFFFSFEKTYLKLKDCNFLFKDMAPFLQEMCVSIRVQMRFKMLKEVDLIC